MHPARGPTEFRNENLKGELAETFETAKAAWPPAEFGLVAIKDEKILELFARSNGGGWKLIHRYPLLAASGVAGPKLRQGDKQVPEGVYGISFLNPNSRYDVSLRVNYPNAFDRQMAAKDGPERPRRRYRDPRQGRIRGLLSGQRRNCG